MKQCILINTHTHTHTHTHIYIYIYSKIFLKISRKDAYQLRESSIPQRERREVGWLRGVLVMWNLYFSLKNIWSIYKNTNIYST